ncbi:MAG: M14 family zinc carboxypeptidase [Armatimonadota bacterium]
MRRLLCCWIFVLVAATIRAQPGQIEISPVEGFNLKIIGRPAANVLEVKPHPPIHNWFAGKFINLPVGQTVEIRLNMTGCDTPGNVADTAKWSGLRPVYTYADPEKYASYEWYRRDAQGRWISGDLFKRADERYAGAGKAPVQSVIPAPLAEKFLSLDSNTWSPWGEIEGGKNDTATRTFTFTFQPAAPTMSLAMHIPYLLSYEREMLARLQTARFPGVFVDMLGASAGGRPLYMIRVDDPEDPATLQITPPANPIFYPAKFSNKSYLMTENRPIVRLAQLPGRAWGDKRLHFLDAREHPSEHVGSWVVLGALKELLADTPHAAQMRKGMTWLLLPVFDQDGVAAGVFDLRTDSCVLSQSEAIGHRHVCGPEALAYNCYLRAFANAGWFFAAAATFYNMECTDGKVVSCPFTWMADKDRAVAFNRFWFTRLQAAGIPAGPETPWGGVGWLPFRLATGCTSRYKALSLSMEVNDRYPGYRLNLDGIELLGADYARAITEWIVTPEGARVMEHFRAAQQGRLAEMEQWWSGQTDGSPDTPRLFDVIVQGF